MSQGVNRLKELLFDNESKTLLDLERRIDDLSDADRQIHRDLLERLSSVGNSLASQRAELERRIADLGEAEQRERLGLLQRLDTLFERTGTEERLRSSVAVVLDGAMREAEVARHEPLSQAIAPLVVRTIKSEIRNSQDELVEALYPMTGRMVKSYVASAMKDLAEQINRRLEQNTVMLRLRSMTTGRSVAELAMADMQPLQVEEIYLIRRGSGALIARWPQSGVGGNRDHAVGGILTAINEFAADAFKSDGSSLRRIDLETAQVYLRASPIYLLAAKCSGQAPPSIEQVIDQAFLQTIERNHAVLEAATTETAGEQAKQPLTGLAQQLETDVAAKQAEIAVPKLGFNPLKLLALLIAIPLIAWLAWSKYTEYETNAAREAAERAIASIDELKGYPVRIEVEPRGRAVNVSGLTPSGAVKLQAAERLKAALPGSFLRESLAVVPNHALDAERQIGEVRRDLATVEAEIARSIAARTMTRAARRIERSLPDLARLEGELDTPATREAVRRSFIASEQIAAEIRAELAPGRPELTAARLGGWRERLDQSAALLSQLIAASGTNATPAPPAALAPANPIEAAEEVSAGAERLAAVAVAVQQANAVRRSLPPPVVPAPAPAPTARERLEQFARANAIFFGNGADYRNPETAEQTLATLAGLMGESGALVRIVGYTDAAGGVQRNTPLSQQRADRVVEDLAARGVPRDRLVAIGRVNALDLSPQNGPGSPNRRVEFELGFVGEGTP